MDAYIFLFVVVFFALTPMLHHGYRGIKVFINQWLYRFRRHWAKNDQPESSYGKVAKDTIHSMYREYLRLIAQKKETGRQRMKRLRRGRGFWNSRQHGTLCRPGTQEYKRAVLQPLYPGQINLINDFMVMTRWGMTNTRKEQKILRKAMGRALAENGG